MVWIIIVLSLIVFSVGIFLLLRPMRIPREPDREGAEDDKALQAYYRASRWPVFTSARYLVLKELTKLKPFGLLVDIGCGPGFLTAQISRKFPAVKVVGLDISAGTLGNARRTWLLDLYPGLEFLQGDAQQLPFADNSVDFFISSLSLHHWTEAQQVSQEIFRTLKPGGKFLIFDLRRNAGVYVYWALKIGQALVAPKDIRKINGAVGSFWASYTPAEIEGLFIGIPVDNLRIDSGPGWMYITAIKTARP